MKKWMFLLLLFMISGISAGCSKPSNTGEVMKINGYRVEAAEISRFISAAKTLTVNRYMTQLGCPYDENFWDCTDGEMTAEEYFGRQLKRLTAENKIVFIFAAQYGLIDSPDYQTFLNMMQTENRSRKEKQSKGEPVYGVLEFTEETYHSYLMSELREELKKRMSGNELAITQEDKQQYYEENIENYLQPNQDAYILLSANPANEASFETAKKKLEGLKGFKGEAAVFKALCETIQQENPALFQVTEGVLSQDVQRQDGRQGTQLYAKTVQTPPKTSGELWQDSSGLHVVYCKEKVPGEAIPITEAAQNIEERLAELRLNELISRMGSEAVIEAESGWLKQIPYR